MMRGECIYYLSEHHWHDELLAQLHQLEVSFFIIIIDLFSVIVLPYCKVTKTVS